MFDLLKEQGADIGFTRALEQVWECDLSIWPCLRANVMLMGISAFAPPWLASNWSAAALKLATTLLLSQGDF